MVTYITAQYRHVVVCSGLYPVRSQSLHGGYSSGCIESAMQPSFTEKSSRTTLHYVIRNDSARDLVLPPLLLARNLFKTVHNEIHTTVKPCEVLLSHILLLDQTTRSPKGTVPFSKVLALPNTQTSHYGAPKRTKL